MDYPVTQTRLDIPRPLITQSHRHSWTYQGLWLPSHTDTAGHTKAFDYPVTQTQLDIPRPLITQSHRHGWTYQGLWLPSHTDTAGHTEAFDYPVTQTRLDIPRPWITQSHRHSWTYRGLWLPSHTDTAGHTKALDYPVMDHYEKVKVVSFQLEPTTSQFTVERLTTRPRWLPKTLPIYTKSNEWVLLLTKFVELVEEWIGTYETIHYIPETTAMFEVILPGKIHKFPWKGIWVFHRPAVFVRHCNSEKNQNIIHVESPVSFHWTFLLFYHVQQTVFILWLTWKILQWNAAKMVHSLVQIQGNYVICDVPSQTDRIWSD